MIFILKILFRLVGYGVIAANLWYPPHRRTAAGCHLMHISDMLKAMIDEFHTQRGWDLETSKPRTEKLKSLGLAA